MTQTNSKSPVKSVLAVNEKYLQLVPRKNSDKLWRTNSSGLVEIIIPRDKLLDRLVRLFRNTPEIMRIHLDPEGSFIWHAIDGQRNIRCIGTLLEAEFGEKVRPLYSKLVQYLSILENNRFITLTKA
jgi:hypothetical protein